MDRATWVRRIGHVLVKLIFAEIKGPLHPEQLGDGDANDGKRGQYHHQPDRTPLHVGGFWVKIAQKATGGAV
jgi:hypothetical protein